jgi:hypothetical protein
VFNVPGAIRNAHIALFERCSAGGDTDPRSVDALAIARVPLEGLYAICLFTEDPDWVDVYLRDGWRKQCEQFLRQYRETERLQRFAEFSRSIGPENLNLQRKVLGISDNQVHTVEFEELGIAMPPGAVKESIAKFPERCGTRLFHGIDAASERVALDGPLSPGWAANRTNEVK